MEDPLTFFLKSGRVARRVTNRLAGLIRKIGFQGAEVETGMIREDDHSVYLNSMEKLIKHFPEKKIIFTLDEISDFLLDVKANAGEENVKAFLKWLRSIRQTFKVQMILTGSINILRTLKGLKAEDLVGDTNTFLLKPLEEEESIVFFLSLLKSRDIRMEGDALLFCSKKIKDGIHYFIQVFADKICIECDQGSVINDENKIKNIYNSFLQSEIPQFSNFNTRLSEYFSESEQRASRKILAHTARSPKDFDELYALAGHYISEDKDAFFQLLRHLCDEGYLIEKDKHFSFISTLLADYWQKHYYFEE